jgi:predicted Fe-S protein YdhL (DUF1289 family)
MAKRIPSAEDYRAYDGAHCFALWKSLDDSWRCPACGRSKFEIMRWTRRTPHGREPFWGWMAGLHTHHDHSQGYVDVSRGRFAEVVICDQCNSADGLAKRRLGLPPDFSFTPAEIRRFVAPEPHGRHKIDFERARRIYEGLREARGGGHDSLHF